MKISAQFTVFACIAFGLVCLGFSVKGLYALYEMGDSVDRELTRGYTTFWLFLTGIAALFGVLSHLIAKGKLGGMHDE